MKKKKKESAVLTRTDGNYISFYGGPNAHAGHLQKELKISADTVPQQGYEYE